MTRKICIVTGSRAEYGLLRWVIQGVREAPDLELQLVVTGSHLAPEFGSTFREIEQDGVPIEARVEMLLSADTGSAVAKSMGLGMIGFADVLARLGPDVVVVLGDRYEVFAAAAAAMVAGLPIAHLHGGESSEGAFDEAIRHSITKMSHLHMVAAEPYRQRVIQLGEDPARVFTVGGLGVDGVRRVRLLSREELQRSLDFEWRRRNLIVTFHPVTLEEDAGLGQFEALLEALHELGDDVGLVFTGANADTGGRGLASCLRAFVQSHPNARSYESLGQQRYLSALAISDGVVGNSSSGLAEAPTFGKPTLNIGDRQRGRLRADSVIDAAPDLESIRAGLATLLSEAFRESAARTSNPYGDGGASARIVELLRTQPLGAGLLKKPFHDLMAARGTVA